MEIQSFDFQREFRKIVFQFAGVLALILFALVFAMVKHLITARTMAWIMVPIYLLGFVYLYTRIANLRKTAQTSGAFDVDLRDPTARQQEERRLKTLTRLIWLFVFLLLFGQLLTLDEPIAVRIGSACFNLMLIALFTSSRSKLQKKLKQASSE